MGVKRSQGWQRKSRQRVAKGLRESKGAKGNTNPHERRGNIKINPLYLSPQFFQPKKKGAAAPSLVIKYLSFDFFNCYQSRYFNAECQ